MTLKNFIAHRKRPWLGALMLLAVWFHPLGRAIAEFVSIIPVADTSILESSPDNNMGAVEFLVSGTLQNDICPTNALNPAGRCRHRALMRFDVAGSVPAGSRIRRAWVQVWVRRQPPNDETDPFLDFGLYRVLKPWSEGTGTNRFPGGVLSLGRLAEAGETTWNHSSYPTHTWSIPGGAPGLDFVATPTGTAFIADEGGSPYNIGSFFDPQLAPDVQLWLDQPGTNFGWMFFPTDEVNRRWTAKRFDARENPYDAFPVLNIEFVPPPRLTLSLAGNAAARIEFKAESEQAYEVQFLDSLFSTNWQILTNVPAASGPAQIITIDSGNTAISNRFYRAVAP